MDGTKQKRVDRRVAKTQKAIRHAFHKLLTQSGIEKITVSALAREADIDRKTFYLHFSSIDDLINQEASILVDRVAHALATPAHDEEKFAPLNMKRVLTELANVAEEEEELYRRIISSLSIDQMVEALYEPVRRAAVENNRELFDSNERGFDYIIRFYIAGTLSMFTQWFLEDHDQPIDSIMDMVERIMDSSALRPLSSAGASVGA